jgi:PAS domain S-box-containing protein
MYMLASLSSDLLFKYDVRANVCWAGERLCEFVSQDGDSGGEFNPGPLSEYLHPADLPHILQSIDNALSAQDPLWEGCCRLIKGDGSFVNVRVKTMLEYEDGQPVRVLGAISQLVAESEEDMMLVQSEQRYRDLVDSIDEGILLTDSEFRTTFMNNKVKQMFGFTADEVYSHDTLEFVHPDDKHIVLAKRRARMLGESTTFDLRVIAKDGQIIWVMAAIKPQFDASGAFSGSLVALTDITQRKQVEAQLLQVVESDLGGIIYWDISGRITNANKAFLRMTGFTEMDLSRGLDLMQITPVEWRAADRLAVKDMLNGASTPVYAKEFFGRNGRRIPVLVRAVMLPGSRTEGVAFVLDNTQKERARRELERLARIVETTSDAVVLLSPEGQIISWNSGAERLYGYHAEEIVGHSGQVLTPPGKLWGFHSIVQRLGAGEVVENYETVHLTANGEERPVSLTISAVADDNGKLRGISQIARDLTARKRAETLEQERNDAQKLEAIGRLAGGVAHEFNNLLMIILSNVQLAHEQVRDGQDAEENFNEVVEACDRAADLTQQLLAFGRRQLQKLEELDVNDVANETLRFARRLIGENIETEFVPTPLHGVVRADRAQLKQILLNIFLNARDVMPSGGKIALRTSPHFSEGNETELDGLPAGAYVMIEIADNGPGMDNDVKARVFEPFFTTKEFGKGTGLGLATVYGIVKQNDGYIHIESAISQGTTFKIFFPAVKASEIEDAPLLERSFSWMGSERILLVEDEDALRSAVKRYLLSRGFQVIEARDGEEGCQLCAELDGEIDLVLTDVVMPKMSGPEMMKRLRESRPNLAAIYMSGYTDLAIGTGPLDSVLQKPFNMNTLASELHNRLATVRIV